MKVYTMIAAALLSIIASAHILRLFFGWEIRVGGLIIPVWVSVPAAIIAGVLASMLWKDAGE